MVRLTEALIRKKAEHHEGPLPELEELSLHQLELERIEVVGGLCRRLKILLLQNNIIGRMENLHHLRSLVYLNLALNNIAAVEGLASCEFLAKLDLTVNFVDIDALAPAVEHLAPLLHLKELFLMGNPCAAWPGYREYVVASLPQLRALDGRDVSRAERVAARQRLPALRAQLAVAAAAAAAARGAPPPPPTDGADDDGFESDDPNKPEPYTPEVRTRTYRELAEQKAEREARERANAPRERDAAAEHAAAVAAARAREAADAGAGAAAAAAADGAPRVRQCNEGRWDFALEDDDGRGNAVLRLGVSRFLDSSLIDVDVHPAYVSVVIKNKRFCVLWPADVRAADGACERSATTGELVVRAPLARPDRVLAPRAPAGEGGGGGGGGAGSGTGRAGRGARAAAAEAAGSGGAEAGGGGRDAAGGGAAARTRRLAPTVPMKLADELAAIAAAAGGAGAGDAGGAAPAPAPAPAAAVSAGGAPRAGGALAAAPAPAGQPFDDSGVPPLE